MKFDWKLLLAELVKALVPIFGEAFRKWFEDLFKKAPEGDLILVGDAPDQLKADLQRKLHDIVAKYLADKPVILRFALMFVNNLPWSFVDDIYDKIFASEIQSGTRAPASATRTTVATAAPVRCEGHDLACAKAEAGIAS